MHGIDSVKPLSKLGDSAKHNAETQRGRAATKTKEQKSRQKNGGRKIFNAENTEECRETQSSKVAERNSLNSEAQRGKVGNQRGMSNQRGKSRRAVKKMEAKRSYRGGTTCWRPKR